MDMQIFNESVNRPIISVFTCVYNRADRIHRVFDSLKSQTFQNFEHIIVDDGSNDRLDEKVLEYCRSVPYQVVYIKKENGGKHTATNVAWDHASGDYIVQLDSDDAFKPHCLEYLLNLWGQIPPEKKDEYWCVHGRCEDQYGTFVGDLYPDGVNKLVWKKRKRIIRNVSGEKIGLMKKSVLDGYRYPEPRYVKFVTESYVWNQVNRLYQTWYSNEVVRIYYRDEADSISRSNSKYSLQTIHNKCWITRYRVKNHFSLRDFAGYLCLYPLCSLEFKQEYRYIEKELPLHKKTLLFLAKPFSLIFAEILKSHI